MVTDVTYFTKELIASKISYGYDNELVIDTLKEDIDKQKDVSRLIIHSDHGIQYTSSIYKVICETQGINSSVSHKGCPQDNTPIESFPCISQT
ncbi:hypothetical protein RJG79_05650 [Mycoplasmatota bacterium WC44]